MWVFSGEKKKLHCFASFGNAEVVRITETDSAFIEINSLPKQIKWKKAAKEYQASAEAIQMAHHIEKHVHCLLFDLFLCWVCVFFFFSGCTYIYLWIWCGKDTDPHKAKSDELYPEHALYLCEKHNRLYSKM